MTDTTIRAEAPTTTRTDRLDALADALTALVSALEPGILEASLAARLVGSFDRIERVASAGKALAAKRVADSNRWMHDGARSPEQWLADKTAATLGQAASVLETAHHVEGLAATDAVFRAGELSVTQAAEVASAATVAPGHEHRLLATAATSGLKGLRDQCRRVRAAADAGNINEKIHRSRSLRHWTDRDGAFCLKGRMTAETGATFLSALEPMRDRLFADARRAGTREPTEAYAADALLALVTQATAAPRSTASDAPEGGPRRTVHVRVDHSALVRGTADAGETCEIPGVGPIPVATAKAVMSDCILSVLVTDGADVRTVAHAGRTIPAKVRSALIARSQTCEVPGCDVARGLEIDHIIPFADGGPSRLDNLQLLCGFHHRQKTHDDYQLTGPPEQRAWARSQKSATPDLVLTTERSRGSP